MNIKNQDYAAQKEKRYRAMNYWQNEVIQNHLPPIDIKKKQEMEYLKKQTTIVSKGGKSTTVQGVNNYTWSKIEEFEYQRYFDYGFRFKHV